jgi:hypothetical protein
MNISQLQNTAILVARITRATITIIAGEEVSVGLRMSDNKPYVSRAIQYAICNTTNRNLLYRPEMKQAWILHYELCS